MDKTLQVQLQIRQNAEEVNAALKDIGKWEKEMANKPLKKTTVVTSSSLTSVPPPRRGGTVPLKTSAPSPSSSSSSSSTSLTPAALVASNIQSTVSSSSIPSPSGTYKEQDPEELERNRGNQFFKEGNFHHAVKSYTKCLGMKSQNYIAFSNRAMAYLKLKEYNKALIDCDCALAISPTHVKTLLRRASANNFLSRHRAALLDLLNAQTIEPSNKQVLSELLHTRELIKNLATKAPLIPCPLTSSVISTFLSKEEIEAIDSNVVLHGPDLPLPSDLERLKKEKEEAEAAALKAEAEKAKAEEEQRKIREKEEEELKRKMEEEKAKEEEIQQVESSQDQAPKTTYHRITIINDSDDEDEEVEVNKPSETEETLDEDANVLPTILPKKKLTNKQELMKSHGISSLSPSDLGLEDENILSKLINKVVKKTKTYSKKLLQNTYELEIELKKSAKNIKKLINIFSIVSQNQVDNFLTNLTEPSLLFHLLNSLCIIEEYKQKKVEGGEKNDEDDEEGKKLINKYFEKYDFLLSLKNFNNSSNFNIFYLMLEEKEKSQVQKKILSLLKLYKKEKKNSQLIKDIENIYEL